MTTVDDTSDRRDPAHPAYVGRDPCGICGVSECDGNAAHGPQSPGNAPPGHETLAAHARATVEADGAETWPDGLVEHIARAICVSRRLDPDTCVEGSGNSRGEVICHVRRWQWYASDATAALSAIRAWEGRE
jgi:hypothetical protein